MTRHVQTCGLFSLVRLGYSLRMTTTGAGIGFRMCLVCFELVMVERWSETSSSSSLWSCLSRRWCRERSFAGSCSALRGRDSAFKVSESWCRCCTGEAVRWERVFCEPPYSDCSSLSVSFRCWKELASLSMSRDLVLASCLQIGDYQDKGCAYRR